MFIYKYMQVRQQPEDNKDTKLTLTEIKAYLLFNLGNICWIISFIYPNQLNIDFYQTSFFRGINLIIIGFILCKLNHIPLTLASPSSYTLTNQRNIILSIYTTSVTFSHFYLPIPIIHTISCTGIFFIFILDYFLNGIKINKQQAVLIAIAVCGTIITINGQLIMSKLDPQYKFQSQFENYRTDDSLTILLVSLLLMVTVIGWSYSVVITKEINFHPLQISFHAGVVTTIFSSVLYVGNGNGDLNMEKMVTGLLLSGLPSSLVTFCFIKSIKMVKDTGVLFLFDFLVVAFGYILSVVLYNETQNIVCNGGIFLMFIGILGTFYYKRG